MRDFEEVDERVDESEVDETINYYNENAITYAQETIGADMMPLLNEFLSLIPHHGTILDLGCGTGRDSKYFRKRGFKPIAVDGSMEMCKIAAKYINWPVICCSFQEYVPDQPLNGIWANASLLHLEIEEIREVMSRLAEYLVLGGYFYASFKYGSFSGERDGRFYTDMQETSFLKLISTIPSLSLARQRITSDVRKWHFGEKWLNVFCEKIRPMTGLLDISKSIQKPRKPR